MLFSYPKEITAVPYLRDDRIRRYYVLLICFFCSRTQTFSADLIIPDPEFERVQLDIQDEFMVLASDGLWDVLSGEDVIEKVQHWLKENKTARECAEDLCALALRLGSDDNVTVVLVLFEFQDEHVHYGDDIRGCRSEY